MSNADRKNAMLGNENPTIIAIAASVLVWWRTKWLAPTRFSPRKMKGRRWAMSHLPMKVDKRGAHSRGMGGIAHEHQHGQ